MPKRTTRPSSTARLLRPAKQPRTKPGSPPPSIFELPLNVVYLVMYHCPIHTLLALRLVSRQMYRTCTSDIVWTKFNVCNTTNIYWHMHHIIAGLSDHERLVCWKVTNLPNAARDHEKGPPPNHYNLRDDPTVAGEFIGFHAYTQLLIVTSVFVFFAYGGGLDNPAVVEKAAGHAGLCHYLSNRLRSDHKTALSLAKWDPMVHIHLPFPKFHKSREFRHAIVQTTPFYALELPLDMLDPHIVKIYLQNTDQYKTPGLLRLVLPDKFQILKAKHPEFGSLDFVWRVDPNSWGRIYDYYPELTKNYEVALRSCFNFGTFAYCALRPEFREDPQILAACFNDGTTFMSWLRMGIRGCRRGISYDGLPSFEERFDDFEYAKKLVKIEPRVVSWALFVHRQEAQQAELKALVGNREDLYMLDPKSYPGQPEPYRRPMRYRGTARWDSRLVKWLTDSPAFTGRPGLR